MYPQGYIFAFFYGQLNLNPMFYILGKPRFFNRQKHLLKIRMFSLKSFIHRKLIWLRSFEKVLNKCHLLIQQWYLEIHKWPILVNFEISRMAQSEFAIREMANKSKFQRSMIAYCIIHGCAWNIHGTCKWHKISKNK